MADIVVSIMLLIASFFTLVGAIGLVRFPDFFMRLHAPTKATTLGVGGVLLASIIHSLATGSFSLHELLITAFLFLTAPVSAQLLARAGMNLRLKSQASPPPHED